MSPPPIDITAEFGEELDPDAVDQEVRSRMQRAMDSLMAQRRLPLVG